MKKSFLIITRLFTSRTGEEIRKNVFISNNHLVGSYSKFDIALTFTGNKLSSVPSVHYFDNNIINNNK
jgi:hypothetical protein